MRSSNWNSRPIQFFAILAALASSGLWLLSKHSVSGWAPNQQSIFIAGDGELLFGASTYEYARMQSGFEWTAKPGDSFGGMVWLMLVGDLEPNYDYGDR